MSNLANLAAEIDRALSSLVWAVSVVVSDASGAVTVTSPAAPRPGRLVSRRSVRADLSRAMAKAHPGAVAEVTLGDTGETFTLTAEGGAFDARVATPPAALPQSDISPSGDMRPMTPGLRLQVAPRALYFGGAGDVVVRTMGSPDALQPAFAVQAGLLLPLRVLEIGAASTATPIFGLY